MWPAVPRVSGCMAGTVSYRAVYDTQAWRTARDRGARRARLRLAAAGHRVAGGRRAGGGLARVVAAREARRAAGDVPDRTGRLGPGDRGADALVDGADRARVADVQRRVQRALPVARPAAGSYGLLSGRAAGGGLPQLRDRRRPGLAAVRPRLRGDRRLTAAAGAGRDPLGADGQPLPRRDPRRGAARSR